VIGPVQVLVVGLDDPTYSGEVLGEFSRLDDAGIVRLIDLLLVSRSDDDTFETLTSDAVPAGFGALAAGVLGLASQDLESARAGAVDLAAHEHSGGHAAGVGATWSLADAIPAGQTAAVALIEHVWASPLRAAILRNGGRPLDEAWLAPDDLARLDALIRARGLSAWR
jgi:hypothetical protein